MNRLETYAVLALLLGPFIILMALAWAGYTGLH